MLIYFSKHNNDRIRFVQNPDGSYCLFKIKHAMLKSTKKGNKAEEEGASASDDERYHSSSQFSDYQSSVNPGKSTLPHNVQ